MKTLTLVLAALATTAVSGEAFAQSERRRPVASCETRAVYRPVVRVERDRCDRPVYRYESACERRPIVVRRPVCESRPFFTFFFR